MIRKFFRWIFRNELESLEQQIEDNACIGDKLQQQYERMNNIFDNLDVSVDLHHHAPSWAVISIQGERTDYIKFVDLGNRDIREIGRFLSMFDRQKVDANPRDRDLLGIKRQPKRRF